MPMDRQEHAEYAGAPWANIEDVGQGSHPLICGDQGFVLLWKFDSPLLFKLRQVIGRDWLELDVQVRLPLHGHAQ